MKKQDSLRERETGASPVSRHKEIVEKTGAEVTPRVTRGRPKGSSSPRRSPVNKGRPPATFDLPSLSERLRMGVIEAIAARMPIAFRLLEEDAIERIENDLEEVIDRILGKERK